MESRLSISTQALVVSSALAWNKDVASSECSRIVLRAWLASGWTLLWMRGSTGGLVFEAQSTISYRRPSRCLGACFVRTSATIGWDMSVWRQSGDVIWLQRFVLRVG